MPKRKFFFVMMFIPYVTCGIVFGLVIELIFGIGENMKSTISFFFVIALIGVPSYLLIKHPQHYNVASQILFNLMLFGASTWFGISVNNKKSMKEATAKWVPAAETACKQLLTISATAERMKRTVTQSCKRIEPVISHLESAQLEPLKCIIESQCRETAEKLANLRNHVDNAVSHLEVFIGANCEGGECDEIANRISLSRKELFRRIDEDFYISNGQCGGGTIETEIVS
ncbi:MAG: hypothetical protein WBC22_07905 [Sedimentisphaerales bacterium]